MHRDSTLPNLLIIGAAKCGTTSLHSYLNQHPEIAMAGGPGSKELRFFWRQDWRDHVDWYRRQFPPAPVRGEATPGYTYHPYVEGVPARAWELVPGARLIYVVGDPIRRIASHWVQRYTGGDRRSFEEWMRDPERPDNLLVCASRYATQLEQYLRYFPREQLLVVDQDDLRLRRPETLGEIFAFLGVDEGFRSPAFDEHLNVGAQKTAPGRLGHAVWTRALRADAPVGRLGQRLPAGVRRRIGAPLKRGLQRRVETPVIDEQLRLRLAGLLRPEAERLRELTGKQFAGWSV